MRSFFIENLAELISFESSFHAFPKEIEHRLSSVLRMKDGDAFSLIDGRGLVVEAVFRFEKKKAGFAVVSKRVVKRGENFGDYGTLGSVNSFCDSDSDSISHGNKSEISIAVSIIRRERFELLIEKAVELGAENIFPIYTEFSKPYGHESANKLQDRWQKIADQTLSQCKRIFRCNIAEPKDLSSLSINADIKKDFDLVIALHFDSEVLSAEKLSSLCVGKKKILLLIGPEGGFSENDILAIKKIDANIFSLNTNILRTETAVMYMLSVLDFK